MATLRKRKGTYFADYRLNGKRVRRVLGKSRKIADLALKDIEVKIAKKELGFEAQDATLFKLFDEYLIYSGTNHSPSTQKRYRAIISHFKGFLRQYPYITKISHIIPKTIEDYKALRKKAGVKNRTINIEREVINSMFNLAVQWGYAKDNPVRGVKPLKEEKDVKPRFLNDEEIKALLENCGDKLYPIFYTFLHTGMRKSELEYLEWNDIDFARRKIKIRFKHDWHPKTSEREIPINNGLCDTLKQHKERAKQGTYVFHDGKGQRIEPNRLRKKLMSLTKRCGFPDVTKLHTFRHTFASHLVMKGVDLPTVKKLLGHSDIKTTMIYSHLADEHVDRAVEKLEF
ncbi:MAG: tyrosine-type recombinase/integrase [Candidatus Omnitrophota bacterium]